jgi:hypothetical protein
MRKDDVKSKGRRKEKILTGRSIDAMSDAERRELVAELDAETPEQRLAKAMPLNAKQRATWRGIKKRMGRPKVGAGFKANCPYRRKGTA